MFLNDFQLVCGMHITLVLAHFHEWNKRMQSQTIFCRYCSELHRCHHCSSILVSMAFYSIIDIAFLLDQSVIKFYPVTKKGGPMKRPLLPWNPQNNVDRSKFYFNVESSHGFLYRLKLRKNTHLFSKTVLHSHIGQEMDCLLSGQIIGDEKSSVGINLCSGKVMYSRKTVCLRWHQYKYEYIMTLW